MKKNIIIILEIIILILLLILLFILLTEIDNQTFNQEVQKLKIEHLQKSIDNHFNNDLSEAYDAGYSDALSSEN